LTWQFWGLVKAGHRLSQQRPAAGPALSREMFTVAQRGLASQTAASLAQMAARGAKGDPAIGALVRERQDLVAEWQNRDRHSAQPWRAHRINATARLRPTLLPGWQQSTRALAAPAISQPGPFAGRHWRGAGVAAVEGLTGAAYGEHSLTRANERN